MALKNRKKRKLRGTKTISRGKRGSRNKGSGGRGYGGSKKHFATWIMRHEPDHFYKKKLKSKVLKPKTISIGYLNEYAIKNNVKSVNALELGYEKVLGSGTVNQALEVTARAFSARAKEKLEKAGGKAIIG